MRLTHIHKSALKIIIIEECHWLLTKLGQDFRSSDYVVQIFCLLTLVIISKQPIFGFLGLQCLSLWAITASFYMYEPYALVMFQLLKFRFDFNNRNRSKWPWIIFDTIFLYWECLNEHGGKTKAEFNEFFKFSIKH